MKRRRDYGASADETATAARVSALGYTTAEPTRKGYTGYEKDAESSLEFAQARYYSTTQGRTSGPSRNGLSRECSTSMLTAISGTKTKRATKLWQTRAKVYADGKVGPKTLEAAVERIQGIRRQGREDRQETGQRTVRGPRCGIQGDDEIG